MMNGFFRTILLASIFCLMGMDQESYAQKRNKTKDQETPSSADSKAVQLEAEALTAEGMKFMMKDEASRALPVFESLIQKFPQDPAGYYLAATALIKLERQDDALNASKKAYELDKSNVFYGQQLAELYAKRRKYTEAAQIYETLLVKSPGNIQYGVELASVYVFNEQFEKAIQTYDLLEKSLGVTEEITHQKEQLYLRKNNLDKAIVEAKKLIDSEPAEVSYRVELAEMLIAYEKINDAIPHLEEALKLNPDEAQAHVLLADIYRRKGDVAKCNQELKMVFANPNLDSEPKIRVLAGYVTMLKTDAELQDAAALAKQLAETHPNDPKAVAMYADQLMRAGKKPEARDVYVKSAKMAGAVFEIWMAILQLDGQLNQPDSMLVHSEQALELFPNQAPLWYFNGTGLMMKKRFKDAISAFEESLKLMNGKNEMAPYIYAQLGDAYNGVGDNEKSDACYDLALKENPNNDHVLNNYSYFLSLRKEKLDLALKMSAKLVQDHKNNATYLDTHAWVLYIRKDYKKAKEYLEKAITDSTAVSGTILEHYGDVLFKLGERENAVAQWKRAKKMGETTELLDRKIATGTLHEQ